MRWGFRAVFHLNPFHSFKQRTIFAKNGSSNQRGYVKRMKGLEEAFIVPCFE